MPLYSCEACNFSTKIKTQYKQHLLTKKHARNTEQTTPILEIPKIPDQKGSTKEHKYRKMGAQRSTKEHATQNPIFSCEYCNNGFSSYKILVRHQKMYCSEISQKPGYKKTEVEELKNIIKEAEIPEDFVILRDRWYSDKVDYGVKLTNRVGTVSVGNQPELKDYTNKECFYTSYQVLIDWNGDVFLCPQDWQRRQTMGNIMQTEFFDIWKGPILSKYRKKLLSGDRKLNPCNKCNADGTVYGKKHAAAWNDLLKI